jgi:hypothetical protein
MGATVEISGTPQVKVSVHATAPIQRIELFRGTELVDTNEPGGGSDQIELIWTGLHSKNRKKQVDWSGSLRLNRGEIENLTSFGFDDPQQGVEYVNETSATWIGRTSGNYQGVRLEIDAPNDAILSLDTEQMQRQFRVDELQCEQRIDIGDVNKHLTVRPTTKPTELDVNCTLEDKHPPSGMNPYYVRIQQADGEMAWTSPVRVTQQ